MRSSSPPHRHAASDHAHNCIIQHNSRAAVALYRTILNASPPTQPAYGVPEKLTMSYLLHDKLRLLASQLRCTGFGNAALSLRWLWKRCYAVRGNLFTGCAVYRSCECRLSCHKRVRLAMPFVEMLQRERGLDTFPSNSKILSAYRRQIDVIVCTNNAYIISEIVRMNGELTLTLETDKRLLPRRAMILVCHTYMTFNNH